MADLESNQTTPINARPKRRPPEAFEDLSLALREHLVWPVEDRLLGLGDRGRAALAGGAVVVVLGLGIGAATVGGSGGSGPVSAPVAVAPEKTPHTLPPSKPAPKPEPTLHGAAPVFKPAPGPEKVGQSQGVESAGTGSAGGSGAAAAATAANTGNPATDTITSTPAAPAARTAGATTSSAKTADLPDGPPAGPAAIAVARKFAGAFVVYETGGDEDTVRKGFGATATPELTKALMRRPPRQPAGVEVPQAKVLNVVPAPSHGTIYPLSVSLLRVGVTSELRLEMEQLKNQGWRVTNVLG
ncbi:MAG TPA: hypothetical protein VFN82_01385 [Solirubrobacterales bacterium]|nr:hypothetical protein [Solirubrobacterales bacterium]